MFGSPCRRVFLFALVSWGALACATRGSGVIVTEERELSQFDSVESRDGVSVRVLAGDSYQATVSADDNLIDAVKISQTGGVLSVDLGGKRVKDATVHVDLTAPVLSSAVVEDGGVLDLDGVAFAETFDLRLTDGSIGRVAPENQRAERLVVVSEKGSVLDLYADLSALDLRIGAGGTTTAVGSAVSLLLRLEGGSVFSGREFPVETADFNIITGSDATLNITTEGIGAVVSSSSATILGSGRLEVSTSSDSTVDLE